MNRTRRAFTLIEMMVVIALIAGLVAYIGYRYTHPLAVGRVTAGGVEVKQIVTAIESYHIDHMAYPLAPGNSAQVTATLFGTTPNQYMNRTPTDGGCTFDFNMYPDAPGDVYFIRDNRGYDGSALSGLTLSDGTAPQAGTWYNLIWDSRYAQLFIATVGNPCLPS